eukprot:396285_1
MSVTKRKHDLIFGYIRIIQALFPPNNPYFNIPNAIVSICISFIYWYHSKPSYINNNAEKNKFIHPYIIKQSYILNSKSRVSSLDEIMNALFAKFKRSVNRGRLPVTWLRKVSNRSGLLKFMQLNSQNVGSKLKELLYFRATKQQLEKGHIFGHRVAQIFTGTCKQFDKLKGYGFITVQNGIGDVFVHFSEIKANGFKCLAIGETVEFEIFVRYDGKRKAINVSGPNGNNVIGQQQFIHNDIEHINVNQFVQQLLLER